MVIKPETNLRMWMVFHRHIGPSEGAGIAFAHSHKEARKVGHGFLDDWGYSDFWSSYIDCAAQLIRNPIDELWLETDWSKLANNEAHAIDNPTSCGECGMWGHVKADGVCSSCGSGSVHISVWRRRNQTKMEATND